MTLLQRPRQKSLSGTSSSHAPFCPSAVSIHESGHSRAASVPNDSSYYTANHHRSKSWVSAFKVNSGGSSSRGEPKSGWEKEGSTGGTLIRKIKKTFVSAYEGDASYSDPASYYPRPPADSPTSPVNKTVTVRGREIRVIPVVETPELPNEVQFFPDRDPNAVSGYDEVPLPATPTLPSQPPIPSGPSTPRDQRRKGYTTSGGALAEWQAELADIESDWRKRDSQCSMESSPRRRRLSTGSRPKIIPHLHLGNVVSTDGSGLEYDSPPKKVLATSSSVPESLNNIWDDFLAEAELTFDEESAEELLSHLPPTSPILSASSSLLAKSPPVSPSKSPRRRSSRHSVLVNPLPACPTQYLDSLLPLSPTKPKLLFPPQPSEGADDGEGAGEEDQSGGSELFLSAFPSPPLAAASVFQGPPMRPKSDASDFQRVPRPVSGASSLAERRSRNIPALVIAPRPATDAQQTADDIRFDNTEYTSSSENVTDRSYFSPATPNDGHGDRSPWSLESSTSSSSGDGSSDGEKERTMTLPILRGLAITGSQVDLLEEDPVGITPSLRHATADSKSVGGDEPTDDDHLALHRALKTSVFSPYSTPSLGGSSYSSPPSSDTEFSLSPYANSEGSFYTGPSSIGMNRGDQTNSKTDSEWEYAERQLNRAAANFPPFLSDLDSDLETEADGVVELGASGRSWAKMSASSGIIVFPAMGARERVRVEGERDQVEELAVVEFGLAF